MSGNTVGSVSKSENGKQVGVARAVYALYVKVFMTSVRTAEKKQPVLQCEDICATNIFIITDKAQGHTDKEMLPSS